MCGGGDGDGVEGGLGHGWLRTPWRTLGSHQHHGGVGRRRVVGGHHAGLHVGLRVRDSLCEKCVCVCQQQYE